ncbi:DUF6221 family protein [Streptomyces misionensis]|uniref:DUF6221 family protein n=1 Tax=Streptomyces misionensis TaxID=67331 RepID=UPI0036CE9834
MPDLHGWIIQQIKKAETTARAATGGPWITEFSGETGHCVIPADAQSTREHVARTQLYAAAFDAEHIAMHDPAATLRRCTADRKILTEHRPYGGRGWDGHACIGCGESHDSWIIDHANDCPTLLALAEGYGLTPEILAALDRPIPEPHPTPKPRGPMPDTRRVPASLRGPSWKARP